LLKGVTAVGGAALAGGLLAACGDDGGSQGPGAGATSGNGGSSSPSAPSNPSNQSASSSASGAGSSAGSGVDLEAARKEGTLVVWHNEQEPDMVKLLQGITDLTGIAATQMKIAPADAVAKLKLLVPQGKSDTDIMMAGQDTAYQLQQLDMFEQYSPPNIDDYPDNVRSEPAGYWTAFYLNVKGMIYLPEVVSPDEAPKSFEDILDPKWKDKIVIAQPTSSSAYAFWYELKDVLDADFWDKLGKQGLVGYGSSNAMVRELVNENMLIVPNMSVSQLTKAKRDNLEMGVNYDSRGIVCTTSTVSIMKGTNKPESSKAYVNYLLSKEGQQAFNVELTGSYSPLVGIRPDVLPDRSNFDLLLPKDMDDFGDPANRERFEKLWEKVLNL
jgi:iron(III) transport system substrate-binding protein